MLACCRSRYKLVRDPILLASKGSIADVTLLVHSKEMLKYVF
jgi:hypothetical protein